MRKTILSTCEKTFLSECILSKQRLDGRSFEDYRNIKINYGSDWGSVHVSLGETRVLAQVTCEVTQPKAVRPNEGLLFINVDCNPMAALQFDPSTVRNSDESVQINRILERAFKDSRCVDLESLCIVAEEKVWSIRVDCNVLNHEGNIIDCASIATLAALLHHKRPDVTLSGEDVIIHKLTEKDPIQLALHHYPVSVTYAIFNKGEIAIADPTAIEERVSEASIVFGLNSYRELCGLHLGGTTLTSSQLLLRCATRGAQRAKSIVDLIKNAFEDDKKLRSAGKSVGFTECVRLNKITSMAQDRLPIKLPNFKFDNIKNDDELNKLKEEQHKVLLLNKNSAVLMPIEESTDPDVSMKTEWIPELDESDMDDDYDQDMPTVTPKIVETENSITTKSNKKRTITNDNKTSNKKDKTKSDKSKRKIKNDDDSEEDSVVELITID